MPDFNPKDLAAINKKRNSRDLPPAFKDPNFKLRPDHKHRVSPVEKRNQLIGDAAKAINAKPKAKSKDEIKSAVKSATPKAGKYVAPYGKVAQKRGEAAARKQDPQGLVHKNNRNPGINVSRKTYTVVKGDSLYGIAEKTLPKGKDLGSWFNAIKKMNAGKKLFSGTGVAIPSKSRPVSGGRGR
jgi:LysM repeat protein